MANPAELLHDQFVSWHDEAENVPATRARGGWGSDTVEAHLQAGRHLNAIDDLLRQMEAAGRRVITYRKYFPIWVQIAFAYPKGWKGHGSAQIDPVAIEHLGNLGDALTVFVPVMQPDGAQAIYDFTTRVSELLDLDPDIPDSLKTHVRDVIQHVHWCLRNYEKVGDFDLSAAVERLAASVIRAATTSKNKTRWGSVFNNFAWPFGVNLASAIPAQALVQLALGG